MCYGPYDHQAMLRDIATRTEGVSAPRLTLAPILTAVARVAARLCGSAATAGAPVQD